MFGDILKLIVVIIIIFTAYGLNMYAVGIDEIKKNWHKYRCNPMIMPFAGFFGKDTGENFVQCVSEIQKFKMIDFLNPVNIMLSLFDDVINTAFDSLNNFRKYISSITGNVLKIFSEVFGVFQNLIIAFHSIIIRMKDMMSKLTGVMITILHVVDGTIKTGESMWKGPAGKVIRTVSCFHPDTEIHLLNGIVKKITEIDVDDVLEDGSIVHATMRLKGNIENKNTTDNTTEQLNDYYKIYDTKHQKYVYVTGEHLVYDPSKCGFVKTKNYSLATHVPDLHTDFVYSLITDTHKLQFGNITFWDWDDPILKPEHRIIDPDY